MRTRLYVVDGPKPYNRMLRRVDRAAVRLQVGDYDITDRDAPKLAAVEVVVDHGVMFTRVGNIVAALHDRALYLARAS